MNYKNHTRFLRLILLLSGNKNLNSDITQISKNWSVFKKLGLHFLHLNINSPQLRQQKLDKSPKTLIQV